MVLGGLIALAATALAGALCLSRLKKHLAKNLEAAVQQQLGLSRRMTEIIIQLQQNQSRQDDQLQKLAEFSLRVKGEVKTLAERQALVEASPDDDYYVKSESKTRFLN